jgi:hypothetical protein
MREAADEVLGELAPEGVVPAELSAARDLVSVQLVEVLADPLRGVEGPAHVARDVVGDARPDAAPVRDVDQFGDRQLAVRHRRVRVAVERAPRRGHRGGM